MKKVFLSTMLLLAVSDKCVGEAKNFAGRDFEVKTSEVDSNIVLASGIGLGVAGVSAIWALATDRGERVPLAAASCTLTFLSLSLYEKGKNDARAKKFNEIFPRS